ncbi:MFS transporter [Pseudomonas caspiana]
MAAVSVLISIAMIVLDAAMLNAVLPLIASEFQIEASQVFWLVMGYQFLMLVPLLFFGSLANAIGARSVFIVGLLLFVVGAFLGISSADLQGLSFARAVQGLGASAVTSVNMALLRFAYSDVHMPKLMGVSAVVVAFSFIVAPLLSVQLFSVAKWGGVLAVGLVLGGFALIAALSGVPRIVCELRCVGARIMWAFCVGGVYGVRRYNLDSF